MGLISSSSSDSKALSSSYSSSPSPSPRRLPTTLPMAPSQPSPSRLDSSSYSSSISSSPSPEYSSSSSAWISSLSDSYAMTLPPAIVVGRCGPVTQTQVRLAECGATATLQTPTHAPARPLIGTAHLHVASDGGGAGPWTAQHLTHL